MTARRDTAPSAAPICKPGKAQLSPRFSPYYPNVEWVYCQKSQPEIQISATVGVGCVSLWLGGYGDSYSVNFVSIVARVVSLPRERPSAQHPVFVPAMKA